MINLRITYKELDYIMDILQLIQYDKNFGVDNYMNEVDTLLDLIDEQIKNEH